MTRAKSETDHVTISNSLMETTDIAHCYDVHVRHFCNSRSRAHGGASCMTGGKLCTSRPEAKSSTVGQHTNKTTTHTLLQNFSACDLAPPPWPGRRQDREQPLTDWRRQPGARSNAVLRLIRGRSCGEAGARTPIMCQNSIAQYTGSWPDITTKFGP